MAKYRTEQRARLLALFSEHPHEAYCARQIAAALAGEGISLSAVYRNLAEMEASGSLQKLSRAGSREAYYRYLGKAECRGHLHLSCKKCGKVVHLDREAMEPLLQNAAKDRDFVVDCSDSVLVGVCGACRKEEA